MNMKPPVVPLEKITALPAVYRTRIPNTYQDENGHMNIRWYLHIYDDAGYPLVDSFGLTPDYHQQHKTGGFDLEHHIHYLNEVHVGDSAVVYVRLLARSAKRIHYMLFMVNETRTQLASIFECVNSFADLSVRRTAAYPPEIAAKIDALLRQHSALDWPAPTCGVMSA
ncbi:MAG TPA: thioesterase family protein [Aggregatilineales bacterium]|nr:thioesterase family protein [Aggregatilineales bacterium]